MTRGPNETPTQIPRNALSVHAGLFAWRNARRPDRQCLAHRRWLCVRDRPGYVGSAGGTSEPGVLDQFTDCIATGAANATVGELIACGVTTALIGTALTAAAVASGGLTVAILGTIVAAITSVGFALACTCMMGIDHYLEDVLPPPPPPSDD